LVAFLRVLTETDPGTAYLENTGRLVLRVILVSHVSNLKCTCRKKEEEERKGLFFLHVPEVGSLYSISKLRENKVKTGERRT